MQRGHNIPQGGITPHHKKYIYKKSLVYYSITNSRYKYIGCRNLIWELKILFYVKSYKFMVLTVINKNIFDPQILFLKKKKVWMTPFSNKKN